MSDWEWVIQEDGADNMLAHWGGRDRRIHHHATGCAGVAATRNAAARRARGAVLRNLDADDMLASGEVLAHTVEVFARHDIAWMVGPVIDLLEDGTRRPFQEVLSAGRIPKGTLLPLWEARDRSMPVHPTSLSMRREVFEEFGPYPEVPYGEDTAFLLPLSQVRDGWFSSVPLALHRKRGDSMTGRLTDDDRRVLDDTRENTARKAREVAQDRAERDAPPA